MPRGYSSATAYAPGVRAVHFDLADPAFPASFVELPEPELPGAAWARVAVTVGGICGSDLHLFAHNTGPFGTIEPASLDLAIPGESTQVRWEEA
jgi:hypothetical protein